MFVQVVNVKEYLKSRIKYIVKNVIALWILKRFLDYVKYAKNLRVEMN
ncbi:hypothetical protein CHCC20442_1514 [Bacillus licheniformis]|nr:hypothetical protein CHCC20442_1514 [Bacillus licheniformis]TWN01107.1 hypothetical protein CHCC14566_0328 [Bacillus licheniformis]